MTTEVNIPGVGVIRFPDSMSEGQIAQEVRRLLGMDDPAEAPRDMTPGRRPLAPNEADPSGPPVAPLLATPGAFQLTPGQEQFQSGMRTFIDEGLPIAGATLGSLAVPPLGPGMAAVRLAPLLSRLGLTGGGLLGLGARGAARFGPTVGAAGGGGAVGGVLAEGLRGGDLQAQAEAGLQSGMEMAAGEALGLGIVTPLARMIAPALGRMTDVGREALDFARATDLPGSATWFLGRPGGLPVSPSQVAPGVPQRLVQAAVDNLLPARAVAQSRRRALVERVLDTASAGTANSVIRDLIKHDTVQATFPRAGAAADALARSLGGDVAQLLGFKSADVGPRQFIARVFDTGEIANTRMSQRKLNDVLTLGLENLLTRSTREVGGRRVIDGDTLLSTWREWPDAVRNLFPVETRHAIEGFGAFASISRGVPEQAAEGLLRAGPMVVTAGTAASAAPIVATGLGSAIDVGMGGGIGAGVAALTASSLMNPRGLLNKWLTNEKLLPEILQVIGEQAIKTETRRRTTGLLDEKE